jgi:transposase
MPIATAPVDARFARGQAIADTMKLTRQQVTYGEYWLVPSCVQGQYAVHIKQGVTTCSCPDFDTRQLPCKHIHAVQITKTRQQNPDGSVTETTTVTEEKRYYPQCWKAYNKAQSVEHDRVQVLLADLCAGIEEPARDTSKKGRKPHTLRDRLFAVVFKAYSTVSSRRFSCDLKEAHARGHVSKEIPGLKVPQFFEDEALTPILTQLVHASALPLASVEANFAVDSTGFGTCRYESWIDAKYGAPRRKAVWVKCHAIVGTRTHVVAAARLTDKDSHDSPHFAPLLAEARKGFDIKEVSADKGYESYANFAAVEAIGAEPFIAFRALATGKKGGAFERAFHYFSFMRQEYLAHYHKRSNVESVFSAVKRKFGGEVRSKTDTAMKNEVLAKLVAHNLCCLIQEQHELGIEPLFWKDAAPAATALLAV